MTTNTPATTPVVPPIRAAKLTAPQKDLLVYLARPNCVIGLDDRVYNNGNFISDFRSNTCEALEKTLLLTAVEFMDGNRKRIKYELSADGIAQVEAIWQADGNNETVADYRARITAEDAARKKAEVIRRNSTEIEITESGKGIGGQLRAFRLEMGCLPHCAVVITERFSWATDGTEWDTEVNVYGRRAADQLPHITRLIERASELIASLSAPDAPEPAPLSPNDYDYAAAYDTNEYPFDTQTVLSPIQASAARKFAQEFQAGFTTVRSLNERATLLHNAGGKVLVAAEAKINPNARASWKNSNKIAAQTPALPGYREAVAAFKSERLS